MQNMYRAEFTERFSLLNFSEKSQEVLFREFVDYAFSTFMEANIGHSNGLSTDKGVSLNDETFSQLSTIARLGVVTSISDFLGPIFCQYTNSEFENHYLTSLRASMMMKSEKFAKVAKRYIRLHDDKARAGALLIEMIKILAREGLNPSQHVWCQFTDNDVTWSKIAFLQLGWLGIAGELLLQVRPGYPITKAFYTPAYYRYGWCVKHAMEERENLYKVNTVSSASLLD